MRKKLTYSNTVLQNFPDGKQTPRPAYNTGRGREWKERGRWDYFLAPLGLYSWLRHWLQVVKYTAILLTTDIEPQ